MDLDTCYCCERHVIKQVLKNLKIKKVIPIQFYGAEIFSCVKNLVPNPITATIISNSVNIAQHPVTLFKGSHGTLLEALCSTYSIVTERV